MLQIRRRRAIRSDRNAANWVRHGATPVACAVNYCLPPRTRRSRSPTQP